jgi:hypothetical protein
MCAYNLIWEEAIMLYFEVLIQCPPKGIVGILKYLYQNTDRSIVELRHNTSSISVFEKYAAI